MRKGTDNSPIGVFDSGFGGLTVAQEIARLLPEESIVYFGDTARCPYGPRDLSEVDGFVQDISTWLIERGVKLLVIACNTGTAAGLVHAQETFDVPVIGVVEPGARAAALATNNRRVGVIATEGTIESGAYTRAIQNIDAGIEVFSEATPDFVSIAEQGIDASAHTREHDQIAHHYLDPFREYGIDTLVLGCTHFPLIQGLIAQVMGEDVSLISSAEEVARDVSESLVRRGIAADEGHKSTYEFFTTGNSIEVFKRFGSYAFGAPIETVEQIRL